MRRRSCFRYHPRRVLLAGTSLVLGAALALLLAGCSSKSLEDDPSVRPGGALDDPISPESAGEVIAQYYSAIDAGDFAGAYALWADSGAASGKTLDEFIADFVPILSVQAMIRESGRVEGAAGSRYVEVPVGIRVVFRDGKEQRFSGRYVLRRSVVDGASESQRRWQIQSGEMKPAR